ncbi:ets DNA-binding protein pokkuri-like [Limulus polyphemus]|uniref:Ets DNA-binding protein pokkuri-like n=1 Tax=Limulus polyphemus TaxID=6850 RepID=A0ABM1TBN2_LIMPO|nr:ets DNA-binding protein pokkuri-like [Limulus polyphemus]XP_022253287.1 ets DNA-binding protein pokkuri-like [Limulus polyphemus]XP_022253288.1 ets DNA-binding protein pokkuri-like [Limulus polyphemus]XP_022253289.1 ets DNA-binding protein pokkuri-like [Limulus polyphemus]
MEGSPASDAAAAALSTYLSLPISSLSGLPYMPFYAMPVAASGARLNQGLNIEDDNELPIDVQSLLPDALGEDPRQWNREELSQWLEFMTEQLSLPGVDPENFHMNGKAVCLLTKSDFIDRAPGAGDVLYNCFQLLLNKFLKTVSPSARCPQFNNISTALLRKQNANGNAASGCFQSASSTSPWPIISSDFQNMGHVVHNSSNNISNFVSDVNNPLVLSPSHGGNSHKESAQTMLPSAVVSQNGTDSDMGTLRTPSPTKKETKDTAGNNHAEKEQSLDKINVRLLWSFLQELLNDPEQRYHHCIAWKDKTNGVFKIVDPHRLARLWGMQKNHLNMNFDKMSRALRYYYRVKILQKEPGERHCYRFLRPAGELRHCKQRSLLIRDTTSPTSSPSNSNDTGTALNMSIKEECSMPCQGE